MKLRKLFALLNVFVLCLAFCLTSSVVYATGGNGGVPLEQAPADAEPVAAASTATEMLVFEVNRKVTKKDKGFPRDEPPRSEVNGDWTTPVNFANGTFYYRVEIFKQPQPQPMQLQFCVWQDKLVLEACGPTASLTGNAGTVVTWSEPIKKMYKKNGLPIDWTRPRQRYGLAIKNSNGLPVSSFSGWNWNGEDPALWYPMTMRFTVVVVAKGKTFSGWQNYIPGAGTVAAADNTAALIADSTTGSGLTWEAALEQMADQQAAPLENRYFLPLIAAP